MNADETVATAIAQETDTVTEAEATQANEEATTPPKADELVDDTTEADEDEESPNPS